MKNHCAFSKNHSCPLWTDYELTCYELEEANSLCHGNWIEIESSWLPRSMMRPCSRTTMQSALRTVDRRWAMTKLVRPYIRPSILKAVGRDLTAGNWGDYDWFSGDSGSSYAMDLGLDFESADKERYDWISVHVTPAMTETVDCLERLGLVTRADLVTYRQLYPEDYGADGSSIWQEVPHTGENAVVYTEDTTSAMVSPA